MGRFPFESSSTGRFDVSIKSDVHELDPRDEEDSDFHRRPVTSWLEVDVIFVLLASLRLMEQRSHLDRTYGG